MPRVSFKFIYLMVENREVKEVKIRKAKVEVKKKCSNLIKKRNTVFLLKSVNVSVVVKFTEIGSVKY